MKIIFVNWTLPYVQRNTGLPYKMEDFELLLNKASIINARKFSKLPIKLYTDDVGYEYYSKNGVIELFDEVDTKTLNEYNKSNFNAINYFTSGKSIAIGKEQTPFIFLDNDFLIKSEIPKWIFDYDLVCTHWEINRGDYFMSEDDMLEYNVDFVQDMMMTNTSFIYLNDSNLQRKYLNNHLKILNKNPQSNSRPLWLMSDQGVMGFSASKLNSKVGSLEKNAYVVYAEREEKQNQVGYLPKWVGIDTIKSHLPKLDYWHMWLQKSMMTVNKEFRNKVMKELSEIVKSTKIM